MAASGALLWPGSGQLELLSQDVAHWYFYLLDMRWMLLIHLLGGHQDYEEDFRIIHTMYGTP